VWGEEVWLPSSPDCNPFDYFVWGVSELRVNAKSHNKFKDLIQKMKELVGSLARVALAKACTSFRSRIEAVFTADGLLDKLFSICISAIFFTSIKSDDFQLCCAIEKKEDKNSRFIAAALYIK
jgi:hypothetical protein